MSDQQQSDLIRLGGLWLNTDKNGQQYMSGSFGTARLLMFRNSHKSGENDPDYVLYVAPGKKREQPAEDTADDSIPF